MIPEYGFKPNNLLINGNMDIPQRMGVNGEVNGGLLYSIDRWYHSYLRNSTLASDPLGRTRHQITGTANSPSSLLISAGGVTSTDTIKVAQRVESTMLRYVQSSHLNFHCKLRRATSVQLDTKVIFALNVSNSTDSYTTNIDRDTYAQRLIPAKVNGIPLVGDLTLNDIPLAEFEHFYVEFETPTNLPEGFEVLVGLERDADDYFANENFLYVTECMLSQGKTRQPFALMSPDGPDGEWRLANRYYQDFPHAWGNAQNTTTVGVFLRMVTEMRIAPFGVIGGTTDTLRLQQSAAASTQSASSITTTFSGTNWAFLACGNFAGLNLNESYVVGIPANNGTTIRLVAEL